MTDIYLSRKNIDLINRLRNTVGQQRFAQTNSQINGHYVKHLRIYATAEDKLLRQRGHFIEISTLQELRAAIDRNA